MFKANVNDSMDSYASPLPKKRQSPAPVDVLLEVAVLHTTLETDMIWLSTS